MNDARGGLWDSWWGNGMITKNECELAHPQYITLNWNFSLLVSELWDERMIVGNAWKEKGFDRLERNLPEQFVKDVFFCV